MAEVAITPLDKGGIQFDVAAFTPATADDFIIPGFNKKAFIAINNGSGGPVDVTIPAVQQTLDTVPAGELDVPDVERNIADGETWLFGPIPSAYVNASGEIHVDYSSPTNVGIAAFSVG